MSICHPLRWTYGLEGCCERRWQGKDGVTIDLSALDQVQLIDSWFPYGAVRTDKVVKISSGAHWRDVYAEECK